MGTLYLIATPIGNLEDLTLRAIRLLGEVGLIAAEDTRRTGLLLKHLGLDTPLLSYHAHNETARTLDLVQRLHTIDVALVSDAGSPGLSDPGHELVIAAVSAGHAVVPVPGPSALIAAVTASGLVANHFTYLGFLPRKAAAADTVLADVAQVRHPLVLFEAPHRIVTTLARLLAVFGDRRAVAARELTKRHEEIRRSTLGHLLDHYHVTSPRGEFVLIVDGAGVLPVPDHDPLTLLAAAMAGGQSRSQAARTVARQTDLPRQDLYRMTEHV